MNSEQQRQPTSPDDAQAKGAEKTTSATKGKPLSDPKEQPFDEQKEIEKIVRMGWTLTNPWVNWFWRLDYWLWKKVGGWLFVQHWWVLFVAGGLIAWGCLLTSRTTQYTSRGLGDLTQIVLFLLTWTGISLAYSLLVREILIRSPYLLELKVIGDPSQANLYGMSPQTFMVRLQARLSQVEKITKEKLLRHEKLESPVIMTDGPGIEFEVAGRTQNLRHLTDSLRRLLGLPGRRILISIHTEQDNPFVSLTLPSAWSECVGLESHTSVSDSRANGIIDAVLRLLFKRVDAQLQIAWLLHEEKDPSKGDKKLLYIADQLLGADKKSDKALGYLALSYLASQENDNELAKKWSKESIIHNPTLISSTAALATSTYELSRAQTKQSLKVKLLRQTILYNIQILKETGLGLSATWNNWGIALATLGKSDEAIDKYKRAIEINPKNTIALSNWGNVLFKQRKYDEASEKYVIALKFSPQFATALYNYGNVFLKQRNYLAAKEKYDQALKIDPQYAKAHNNLGIVLSKLGKYEEAIKSYVLAFSIDSKNPTYLTNQGDVLTKLLRIEEANEKYVDALKINPTFYKSYFHHAENEEKDGFLSEALENYETGLELAKISKAPFEIEKFENAIQLVKGKLDSGSSL